MHEVKISEEDFIEIAAKTAARLKAQGTAKGGLTEADMSGLILQSLREWRSARHHVPN